MSADGSARRRLENGAVVELGAEFVLPGYDVLRATAARLGLDAVREGDAVRRPRAARRPPVTRDGARRRRAALPAAARRARSPTRSSGSLDVRRAHGRRSRRGSPSRRRTSSRTRTPPTLAEGAAGFGDFPSHGVAGGNDRIALRARRERSTCGSVHAVSGRRLVGRRRRRASRRRRGRPPTPA